MKLTFKVSNSTNNTSQEIGTLTLSLAKDLKQQKFVIDADPTELVHFLTSRLHVAVEFGQARRNEPKLTLIRRSLKSRRRSLRRKDGTPRNRS